MSDPGVPAAPLRACFLAPLLWPLWSDGRVAFTGGAEVQQAGLARGLAARGVDVTVVCCDFGQPSPTRVHGVRVLRSYRLHAGIPVLRFFHPRLTSTWTALHAADADVYYVRGASLEAGVAYEVARMRGVPFVFGAAHEHDAHFALPELSSPRDRAWYRRALHGAAAVIAQTGTQQRLFRQQFGVDSLVVRNLVELPEASADPGSCENIVWLATYKASKRPDWFLELARALPHRHFVMCGVVPEPPTSTEAWDEARTAARDLPNLEVRGFVQHDQVARLHQDAALFVHSSPAEGFSNTLLEAWASGLPSVSCTDPDGAVAGGGLGGVVEHAARHGERRRGMDAGCAASPRSGSARPAIRPGASRARASARADRSRLS